MLLCFRGLALWVVWPVAAAIWLIRIPYALVSRRQVQLRHIAGWLDANLIATL